jgi:hypothetical protein
MSCLIASHFVDGKSFRFAHDLGVLHGQGTSFLRDYKQIVHYFVITCNYNLTISH